MKNKLLWISLIVILFADILSYFFAGTTQRNLSTQIPLFIKEFLLKNKFGAVLGLIIGSFLGFISYGTGVLLLLIFFPLSGLIGHIIGCGGGGESCWSVFIYLSIITLGLYGLLIGAYIQN